MVDGLGLHILLTKSYTMVPGVTAPQDFLKVLLQCEFRVESDTWEFHLRIHFFKGTLTIFENHGRLRSIPNPTTVLQLRLIARITSRIQASFIL